MESLLDILATRRQHNSEGERTFIDNYIMPLKPQAYCNPEGEVLAYVVDNSHGSSKVLWSAHIDTMHRKPKEGTSEVFTQEVWATDDGMAFVDDSCDCLGADDGAGMWLMFNMIMQDVAGTYIFHRGEEVGCWGSGGMVDHHKDWLKQFTHAIAFDRRGTTSIITHQRSERACSDALGEQLISLFNMRYELDDTGVYTDTAEYMEIIPECVNISIGYDHEHSNKETLDMTHCLALRDAVCALDWDKVDLIVERDPTKHEYKAYKYGVGSSWGYGGYADNDAWSYDYGTTKKSKASVTSIHDKLDKWDVPTVQQILSMHTGALAEWVSIADPNDVAWVMQDLADQLEVAQDAMNEMYDDDYNALKVGMM